MGEHMNRKMSLRVIVTVIVILTFALKPAESQQPRQGVKAIDIQHPGSFRDCSECPEMMILPSGTFLMGAGSDDAKGFVGNQEVPQHRVSIKSFSVSKFDITRGEWKTFVDATSRSTSPGCNYSGLP